MPRNDIAQKAQEYLDAIIRENPDLGKFAENAKRKRAIEKYQEENDTSDSFAKLTESINKVADNVSKASGRSGAITGKKQIEFMTSEITKSLERGLISEDEGSTLLNLLNDLKEDNKRSLKEEHSFIRSTGKLLKDKLPSIGGVLGALNLDNPAFLFMGSLLQDIFDQAKERKAANEELTRELHEESIQQAIKDTERTEDALKETAKKDKEKTKDKFMGLSDNPKILQTQVDLLTQIRDSFSTYLGDLTNSLSNDPATKQLGDMFSTFNKLIEQMTEEIIDQGEAIKLAQIDTSKTIASQDTEKKFKDIENQREQARRDEQLVDAITGLKAGEDIGDMSIEDQRSGLLGAVGGFYDSLMLTLLNLKTFLGGAGKKLFGVGKLLFRSVGKFAGPVGIAITAFEFFTGAWEGWGNAAEKLGKDLEDVTVTDKIASAIGGGIGKIVGLADDLLGLVGIETDIGGWLDSALTEYNAWLFDTAKRAFSDIKNFFVNIFTIAFPEGFSLTEMLKAPYRLITGWWETLFHIAFPKVDFSLTGILTSTYEKVSEWIESWFDFEMPELPDIAGLISRFFDSIMMRLTDTIKNLPGGEFITKKLGIGQPATEIPEEVPEAIQSPAKTVDALKESGTVVDRNWKLGNSEITDWEPIRELNAKEIQAVLNVGDYDKPTNDMLQRLLVQKQQEETIPFSGQQPKQSLNEKMTDAIMQNGIEKESQAMNKGSGSAVIAPSSSNVNNINNSNTSTTTHVSPFDTDPTLQMLQRNYGY